MSTRNHRRLFLKKLSLTGAAMAAAAALPASFSLRVAAASLEAEGELLRETRLLMGTMVSITLHSPSRAMAEDAMATAFTEMERLIQVFDRHAAGTALEILNSQGCLAHPPEELRMVLTRAERLGLVTSHAFNPAIAPLVDMYRSAARSGRLPKERECTEILPICAPGGIQLEHGGIRLARQGMRLTLDGIAKGYIADAASDALLRSGIADHMVDAGGDLRVQGRSPKGEPWLVAIENPASGGVPLALTRLSGGGIATSGGYASPFDRAGKHHHLINHRTGQSPDIASVTVMASSAMLADGLATALSLMPPSGAMRFMKSRKDASCLVVDAKGQFWASPGWTGKPA